MEYILRVNFHDISKIKKDLDKVLPSIVFKYESICISNSLKLSTDENSRIESMRPNCFDLETWFNTLTEF